MGGRKGFLAWLGVILCLLTVFAQDCVEELCSIPIEPDYVAQFTQLAAPWSDCLTIEGSIGNLSVIASRPIAPNSLIMRVPKEYLLGPTVSHVGLEKAQEAGVDLPGRARLALLLLLLRADPQPHRWTSYVRILPPELDTPLFWSDEELKNLEGRSMADRLQLADFWEDIVPPLRQVSSPTVTDQQRFPEMFHGPNFSLERWLWAWGILWSRSFLLQTPSAGPNSHDLFLVPLADLLNHRSDAQTTFQLGGREGKEEFGMFVGESYPVGGEVYNNYSPRPNGDLLRLYGFLLPGNSHRRVPLALALNESEKFFSFKEQLLSRLDWGYPSLSLTLRRPYPYSEEYFYVTDTHIPPEVRGFLRLKLWKPTAAQQSAPPPTFLRPFSKKRELEVTRELKKVLQETLDRYSPSEEEEDLRRLQSNSLSERERLALQLTMEEKRTLRSALSLVS